MKLRIGRRLTVEVRDFAHASEVYGALRSESGEGASTFPNGTLPGHYISYNGRVWAGTPQKWNPEMKPVYCPSQKVPLMNSLGTILDGDVRKLVYLDSQLATTLHDRPESVLAVSPILEETGETEAADELLREIAKRANLYWQMQQALELARIALDHDNATADEMRAYDAVCTVLDKVNS